MATIHVQPVTGRKQVSQKAIAGVVRQIAEKFHPQKIILFGSYARGNPQPDSDVDLLVVMETPLKEMQQAVRICLSIDYHFGLDLIVRTPRTLKERIAMGDSFLCEITADGKVVYEAAGR